MQFSPNRGYQQQALAQQQLPYSPSNGLPALQGGSPYRNQPDQRVYGSGHASLLVKPSLIAHQPAPLSPPPQQQPRPRSPPGWIQQQQQQPAVVASPQRTLQSSPSESGFRSPFAKQPVGGRMQHSHSDAMLKTSPQPAQQGRQAPPPPQVNRPSAKWLAEQEAKKQQALQQQQQSQQQQQPLSPSQALPAVQQPLSPQRQQSMQQHQSSAPRFPNQHLSPQQQLQAQRGANHAAVSSPSRLAPLLGYQTTSKVAAAEMQAAAERQRAKEEHEAAIRREQQQQQQQQQEEQEQYESAMAQQQQQQWQQQVQDQLQQQGQQQEQQHQQFADGSSEQQQQQMQAAWEQQQAEAADRAQGQDAHDQGPPSDPAAAEAYWAEQAEQERYMQWLAQQEALQRENIEAQAQPHHWQQPIGQPHAQPTQGSPARGASFSMSPTSRAQQLGATQQQTQSQSQSQAPVIAQPHTFLSWAPSRGHQGGTSLGTSVFKRSTVHFTSPASLIQHAGQEDERSRFQSHMAESYAAPGGWRPPPPKVEPEVFRSNTETSDNYKAVSAAFYAQRVSGPKGASSAGTGLPGADYAARMAASFATKQRAENQYAGFGAPPQPRPTQLSPTKFPTLNLRP